jgi:hypothetical protein
MAAESLEGGETGKGRGVGAGGSNELDAARNAQSKSFFLILGLPGGFFVEGMIAFQILFFVLDMKKKPLMTFLQGDCFRLNKA